MAPTDSRRLWRYVRGLAPAVLLWALVLVALRRPLQSWLQGEQRYDEEAVREWVEEARAPRQTLPEMVEDYLDRTRAWSAAADRAAAEYRVALKREEIREHLKALGDPPTKMYAGQLPLFPVIYRLEVRFDADPHLPEEMRQPIVWDSQLPRREGQYRELAGYPVHPQAQLFVQYQLHAYSRQQRNEQAAAARLRWVIALAVAGTALALSWVYLVQHRERDRDRQEADAQKQIDRAERLRLEEELRRQEAERRREEAERRLLEQQLATQAAERQALELKSQLYASIGIMAGSYAHNIKNLLVRPNDLLRRCLEADGLSPGQEEMLHEIRETLGTVTERLQQILKTVRRDPSRSELERIDLADVVRGGAHTWADLARDKWKLDLVVEAEDGLWIDGDRSHLQQAVENLLFNARDATFEMRAQLRSQAHQAPGLGQQERREALIAAAAWRGTVVLRARRQGDRAVLEVRDNGVGMTEEVRRRCTETHFSTKRDNALYEGHSTGMGLGLSFVAAILEHHGAALEVESAPLKGTTFRATFAIREPAGAPARA